MNRHLWILGTVLIALGRQAHAETPPVPKPSSAAPPAATAAGSPARPSQTVERINVDTLKQRYWETAEDTDPKVVQNRIYKKEHKLELQAFVGTISSDPFLSVRNTGFSFGFHFTESLALNALYWKAYSSKSSSLDRLEQETGRSANTNDPKSFSGGEFAYSPIYGKLSVFGKAILHYDLHFLAGGGVTNTLSGKYTTLHLGLGQQIYLSKVFALRLDYRLMRYQEDILEQHRPAPLLGTVVANRVNFTDAITLGISAFLGFGD